MRRPRRTRAVADPDEVRPWCDWLCAPGHLPSMTDAVSAGCVTPASRPGPRDATSRLCACDRSTPRTAPPRGRNLADRNARRASLGARERAVLRHCAADPIWDVGRGVGERPAEPALLRLAGRSADVDRLASASRPRPHVAAGTGAIDCRTTFTAHASPCAVPRPEGRMITHGRAIQRSRRPPRPSVWWRATSLGNRATRRSLRYAVPVLWGAVVAMQSCARDGAGTEPRTTARNLARGAQETDVRLVPGFPPGRDARLRRLWLTAP